MDQTAEQLATTRPSRTRNRSSDAVRDALAWDRVMLRADLRLYIRSAWHVVEPTTCYLENWHIDLIAEYLEAVTAREIKRLGLNQPPRDAQRACVSIMWSTCPAERRQPGTLHSVYES